MTQTDAQKMSQIFNHVKGILAFLVDKPDELQIYFSSDQETKEFVVYVKGCGESFAQVLGKKGAHAKSLRSILHAIGMAKFGQRIRLVAQEKSEASE